MAEIGDQIGPYRLLSEVGRGGMAVVYRAARVVGGFEQGVALKLLRRGTDSDDILARFRQERQILAALDHPSIARLLDGGATADGQPFLAMELVEGERIDRYCEARALDVPARLRLMADVGKAVAHAHAKLVVHRDLKPANVLVTDGGRVKLLDFGVAKLLSAAPTTATPVTRTQQRFLTPEYASPEQIRGEAITTATDVYQLGLLLYELLAGRRPFSGSSSAELERAICERAPDPPSTAGSRGDAGPSSDPATGAEAASERRRSRRRRARDLRGDLDNIVLMALRKEPQRRYSSVIALVEDLERYLAGHPVSARGAGWWYRGTKFARRHAWALASCAAALALLVVLTVVYTRGLERERDLARRESEKARTVAGYLTGVLGTADPFSTRGRRLDARALLDEAARRVDAELTDQPEVRAATLARLGDLYARHGIVDEARYRLEESLAVRAELLPDDDPRLAESRYLLGRVLVWRGGVERHRGKKLLEQALAVQRVRLGERDLAIARTLLELAGAEATLLEEEASERHFDEAIALFEAAAGPDRIELATALLKRSAGLEDEPEKLAANRTSLERALGLFENAGQGESARAAITLVRLAGAHLGAGDLPMARGTMARAEALAAKTLDPEHPNLAELHYTKGKLLSRLGEWSAASESLARSLAIERKFLAPSEPLLAARCAELVEVERKAGGSARARALCDEALVNLGIRAIMAEHP